MAILDIEQTVNYEFLITQRLPGNLPAPDQQGQITQVLKFGPDGKLESVSYRSTKNAESDVKSSS
jgi:hypothetical protein